MTWTVMVYTIISQVFSKIVAIVIRVIIIRKLIRIEIVVLTRTHASRACFKNYVGILLFMILIYYSNFFESKLITTPSFSTDTAYRKSYKPDFFKIALLRAWLSLLETRSLIEDTREPWLPLNLLLRCLDIKVA